MTLGPRIFLQEGSSDFLRILPQAINQLPDRQTTRSRPTNHRIKAQAFKPPQQLASALAELLWIQNLIAFILHSNSVTFRNEFQLPSPCRQTGVRRPLLSSDLQKNTQHKTPNLAHRKTSLESRCRISGQPPKNAKKSLASADLANRLRSPEATICRTEPQRNLSLSEGCGSQTRQESSGSLTYSRSKTIFIRSEHQLVV